MHIAEAWEMGTSGWSQRGEQGWNSTGDTAGKQPWEERAAAPGKYKPAGNSLPVPTSSSWG